MRDARTDRLHEETHRFTRHGGEALHAQHFGYGGHLRDTRGECRGVANFRQRDEETVELVMIVIFLVVVAGTPVLDIVFGADAEAEQRRRIDLARSRGDDLDRARQGARDRGHRFSDAGRVKQIALGEHHEIGASDLILEHLLDRIVVIERIIGRALARERLEIGGDMSAGKGCAIDHGDDAIDGDARLYRRPMEGLNQGLRQREAGRFDHDMLDAWLARENQIECGDELVRHRAAQAPVGQLDDILFGAGGVAATFENFAVDADVAEFVDDHRDPSALRVSEQMADQRRLAGAEKAGDDGARHARE
jgi:hypothetical protein